MTYLMFIHDLDETDNLRAREAAMLGLPYASPFAKEVQVGARTVEGARLKWSTFHDFLAAKMYETMQEWVFPFIKELHGDKDSAYSKYMGDAIFKIPTPRHIIRMIVDLMEPQANDVVCDPACGTSGFLVAAGEYLKENRKEEVFFNRAAEDARARTEQSFFVPKQEIVDNAYDLSINKYKKTEYIPVEYPPTSEILADIEKLEAEIQSGLKELKGFLHEK